LEVPVEDVLARIGRPARKPRPAVPAAARPDDDGSLLATRLRRLSDRDRAVVERVVDAMIELEDRD
jgi:hypothetical protein